MKSILKLADNKTKQKQATKTDPKNHLLTWSITKFLCSEYTSILQNAMKLSLEKLQLCQSMRVNRNFSPMHCGVGKDFCVLDIKCLRLILFLNYVTFLVIPSYQVNYQFYDRDNKHMVNVTYLTASKHQKLLL